MQLFSILQEDGVMRVTIDQLRENLWQQSWQAAHLQCNWFPIINSEFFWNVIVSSLGIYRAFPLPIFWGTVCLRPLFLTFLWSVNKVAYWAQAPGLFLVTPFPLG